VGNTQKHRARFFGAPGCFKTDDANIFFNLPVCQHAQLSKEVNAAKADFEQT